MNYNNSKLSLPKSIAKIALSPIPVVGSAVAEIIGYFDDKYIENRLLQLENKLIKLEILDDFIEQIKCLEEHQYFSFRNNLKFLLTSALPETVDVFILSLIDSITSETQNMAEEVCEVLRQLNANDITTLRLLCKHFEKSEINANER